MGGLLQLWKRKVEDLAMEVVEQWKTGERTKEGLLLRERSGWTKGRDLTDRG